jgi:hypothetical protein
MSEKQTITTADVGTLDLSPRKETRAERLARLLTKALPKDAARIASGSWGPSGPPYVFDTTREGKERLLVENAETGERIGVVGATRDELLDALEARLA